MLNKAVSILEMLQMATLEGLLELFDDPLSLCFKVIFSQLILTSN